MRTLGIEDTIGFGKHCGETVRQVMDDDFGYIYWLWENTEMQFSEEIEKYAEEYKELLDACEANGLHTPYELSKFISDNNMAENFPHLAGDVEFNSGYVLENGISPRVYASLCRALRYGGKKADRHVVRYTRNEAKCSLFAS